MAVLDDLLAAKAQIVQRIIDVTASPNPDVSENGRSVNAGSYLAQLTAQLEAIDNAIMRAGGPVEVRTRAVT